MIKYLIISLRIPHWIKNSFLFAALIFSHNLFDPAYVTITLIAFVLFCFTSSSVYLINDLIDLPDDKKHPIKKNRPIASGKLSKGTAIWTAILLIVISFPIGIWINASFGAILIIYFLFEMFYSLLLKHVVILDVFGIAFGFILRVIAGGVVINVEVSHWVLICTALISLFLGFSKRRHELVLLGDEAHNHRRVLTEYSPYFLDQMISVVTSSTLIAYVFYTMSPETINKFGTNKLILTSPFVLYGIFRYLYLVHKKEQGGSPTKLLLTDIPLLINTALWVVMSIIIIYN